VIAETPEYVVMNKPPGVQVAPTVDNRLECLLACAAQARRLRPPTHRRTCCAVCAALSVLEPLRPRGGQARGPAGVACASLKDAGRGPGGPTGTCSLCSSVATSCAFPYSRKPGVELHCSVPMIVWMESGMGLTRLRSALAMVDWDVAARVRSRDATRQQRRNARGVMLVEVRGVATAVDAICNGCRQRAWLARQAVGSPEPLLITHRLDACTEGVVVLAKTRAFVRRFNALLQAGGGVRKLYRSLSAVAPPIGQPSAPTNKKFHTGVCTFPLATLRCACRLLNGG
jgi:RNA pseudouridylate synthase